MSTIDAISKGIGAHGMWKQRLIDAINTGQSEWTPSVVCQDDQCEFGKWFYSCSDSEKKSSHYDKIKTLHASFHKTAADVLGLALGGKKTEAEKAIGEGSDYKSISYSLTKEMMAWKSSES